MNSRLSARRLVLGIVVLLCGYIGSTVYRIMQQPIEGSLAAKQLNGHATASAVARTVATTNIPQMILTASVVVVALLWVGPLIRTIGRMRQQSSS